MVATSPPRSGKSRRLRLGLNSCTVSTSVARAQTTIRSLAEILGRTKLRLKSPRLRHGPKRRNYNACLQASISFRKNVKFLS